MTVPEDTELSNINRNSNAQINTTVVFQTGSGTDVRYNAGVRPRGQGSRNQNPITMRLELPHDRDWNGVVEMNLNSQYAFNQVLGNAMYDLANLAGPDATAVRVRRNGRTDNNTSGFGGFYAHMEVVNSDWAENHLPDDSEGNVYTKRRPDNKWAWRNGNVAIYTGDPDNPGDEGDGWDKQSNRALPDWDDLDEFLRVMNQASGDTYYEQVAAVANIDQFVHYFAPHDADEQPRDEHSQRDGRRLRHVSRHRRSRASFSCPTTWTPSSAKATRTRISTTRSSRRSLRITRAPRCLLCGRSSRTRGSWPSIIRR